MTGSAISVLVVDENWLVRLGLSSLLSEEGQFGQILESDSIAGALSAVQQYAPDVVISDVHLPDGSGIEMCRQIRRAHPSTHVMFLTTCCHEDLVIGAMLAGASGYLLKNNDPERLRSDVLTVAAGGSVLDALVSDIVLLWMRRAAESGRPADRISEHERKILPLIAQGKTNRQIAAELYLSEHTIKTYVSALLKKLQLARRSEAAAYIARQEQLRAS